MGYAMLPLVAIGTILLLLLALNIRWQNPELILPKAKIDWEYKWVIGKRLLTKEVYGVAINASKYAKNFLLFLKIFSILSLLFIATIVLVALFQGTIEIMLLCIPISVNALILRKYKYYTELIAIKDLQKNGNNEIKELLEEALK